MRYAEKLTLRPGVMKRSDIGTLSEAMLDDGEILEANQIIGHFNYVNRCLIGHSTKDRVGGGATGPAGALTCGTGGSLVPHRPSPGRVRRSRRARRGIQRASTRHSPFSTCR